MSPDTSTYDKWPALGAALRRRREERRMTRADVAAAGGPSPATIQRIEEGKVETDVKHAHKPDRGEEKVETDVKHATKSDLERALDLPSGWINDFLAGRATATPPAGPAPIVIEGDGERLLVAITEGSSRLSLAERRAVLALIRTMTNGSDL